MLESFRGGADDILRRFAGVRLGATTVRSATEAAGERLMERQRAGAVVKPAPAPAWDFRLRGRRHTAAYLGLDAFSVPMQQPGGAKAEGRMLYTAVLYTPDKSRSHYLVDFDLDRLAGQMRQAAIALGLGEASQVIAITDAGNGIEAALRRHFWDDLLCISIGITPRSTCTPTPVACTPQTPARRQHGPRRPRTSCTSGVARPCGRTCAASRCPPRPGRPTSCGSW